MWLVICYLCYSQLLILTPFYSPKGGKNTCCFSRIFLDDRVLLPL